MRNIKYFWNIGRMLGILAPIAAGCGAIQDAIHASTRPPIPESAVQETFTTYEDISDAVENLAREKHLEKKLEIADYLVRNASLFSIDALTKPGIDPYDHADLNALKLQNRIHAKLIEAEKNKDLESQIILRRIVDRIDPEREHLSTINMRNYSVRDYFKDMNILLTIFGADEKGNTAGLMLPLEVVVQGVASLAGEELEDGTFSLRPEIPKRLVTKYTRDLHAYTHDTSIYRLDKEALAGTIQKLPSLPDKWAVTFAQELTKMLDLEEPAIEYDAGSVNILLAELTKRSNGRYEALGPRPRAAVAGLLTKIVVKNNRFLLPEHQDFLAGIAIENEDARDVLCSIDYFYLTEKVEQKIKQLAGMYKTTGAKRTIVYEPLNISFEVDDPMPLAVVKKSSLQLKKPDNVLVDNHSCEFLKHYKEYMGLLERLYFPQPESIEQSKKHAVFLRTEKSVVSKLVDAFYQAESYTEAVVGISLAQQKSIGLNLSEDQIVQGIFNSLNEIDFSNEGVSRLETYFIAKLIGKYQQHDAANYLLSLVVEKGDNGSLRIFRDAALDNDLQLDDNLLTMYKSLYQSQNDFKAAAMVDDLMGDVALSKK